MSEVRTGGERRLEQLRMLTEVSRALTYTTEVEDVLRLAVQRAADLLAAEKAVLMLTDDEGFLSVRAAHGVEESLLERFREPLNESLVDRLQGIFDYHPHECFLSVPLVVQGQVIGLLAAVRSLERESTEADEWLLSALADQAAVALENARLTHAVQEERQERLRATEQAKQARDHTHATLGHELRSPLTAIDSYAALMLDGLFGDINDRQREALARIRLSGQHLLSVLENVLEMARLNAGGVRLVPSAVRVGEVIAEAVQMVQLLAAEKSQRLRVTGAPELIARADPSRVRQVLVNVVNNAIKYTPAGGNVRISAAATDRGGTSFALIEVNDSGPGIPAGLREAIFEPYYRGPGTGYEEGIGLGLAISRELLRQMGGEIEVESAAGEGSTFRLLLPLWTASE